MSVLNFESITLTSKHCDLSVKPWPREAYGVLGVSLLGPKAILNVKERIRVPKSEDLLLLPHSAWMMLVA